MHENPTEKNNMLYPDKENEKEGGIKKIITIL